MAKALLKAHMNLCSTKEGVVVYVMSLASFECLAEACLLQSLQGQCVSF